MCAVEIRRVTVTINDDSELIIYSYNPLIPGKSADTRLGSLPTKQNIRDGLVVLVDGYEVGLSVICLAAGASSAVIYPHLNPLRSHFYTDVYRWVLRYVSM